MPAQVSTTADTAELTPWASYLSYLMSLYLFPESRELKDSMPPCTLYSVVTVKDAAAEGKR
jgi:hypothetical protein